MRLFSLTSLLTSIIFIYAIFTLFNNNNDKTKIISIIFVFIIGMYLFNNLDIYKNYTTLIDAKIDSSKTKVIPIDNNISKGTYSLSMWLYIDDWNYKYGEKKEIIKRVNNKNEPNPFIYFDLYENNIITEFYVKPPEAVIDNYDEALKYCTSNNKNNNIEDLPDSKVCSLNKNTGNYEVEKNELKCVEGKYYCLDDTTTDFTCDNDTGIYKTTLTNIPIQKWFHLSYAFGNKHVDTYLNGKLIGTKTFDGVQFLEEYVNSEFIICGNGGFSGSITKVKYYNNVISPQNAWNIYKEGFNSVMLTNIFNRYNASVTFYEDDNEKVKYYIV